MPSKHEGICVAAYCFLLTFPPLFLFHSPLPSLFFSLLPLSFPHLPHIIGTGSPSSSTLTTSARAGIGAGVIVVVLLSAFLLLALALFLYAYRRPTSRMGQFIIKVTCWQTVVQARVSSVAPLSDRKIKTHSKHKNKGAKCENTVQTKYNGICQTKSLCVWTWPCLHTALTIHA